MVWYVDRERTPEEVQQWSTFIMRDLWFAPDMGLGVPYDDRTPEQKLAWQRQADPNYERIPGKPGGRWPRRGRPTGYRK